MNYGLKFRITGSYILLLTLGMVLTDIVIVTFWQKAMVRGQIDAAVKILTVAGGKNFSDLSEKRQVISNIVNENYVQVAFFRNNTFQKFPAEEKSKVLNNALQLAAITTSPVLRFEGNMWGVFNPVSRYVILAQPLAAAGFVSAAAGLVIDLKPVYQEIYRKQKLILMYILLNVMVLSVVGLFRMIKFIVKPLEHLVQMTRSYRFNEGEADFVVENEGHEFRKLAFSLNSMVRRIENDRDKLKQTVRSLSDANDQLRRTRKEIILAEKMAAVGVLSAGMAHEIGNPLGVIQGYLELLNDEKLTVQERKLFINNAIAEVARVDTLIHRLLDFAGHGEEDDGILDIKILLDQLDSMVRVHKKLKNINYSREIKLENPLFIRGGKSLLQVLLNCFLNAVDAVEAKGGNLEKTINLFCEEGIEDGRVVVIIRLADNGTGIEEEKLSSVFNPFYTTKKPGKGTGLGLSVSYSLIDALGGKIWLESSVGTGTVVHLVLPVVSPPSSTR